jgi:hypothetical protein
MIVLEYVCVLRVDVGSARETTPCLDSNVTLLVASMGQASYGCPGREVCNCCIYNLKHRMDPTDQMPAVTASPESGGPACEVHS